MVVVELLFIASWHWTISSKNNLALKVVADRLEVQVDSLENLKKVWLRKTFEQSPFEYLDIAEHFTKTIELKNTNKPIITGISKDAIFDMVMNDAAKPRILALFLSLCSVVGVLILKDGNGFKSLIEGFNDVPFLTLLFVDAFYAFAILCFFVAFKFVFSFIYVLLSIVNHSLEGRRAQSDYIAKSLIRDLINYHRTKVGKYRVKS